MLNFRPIMVVDGFFLVAIGLLMVAPAVVDWQLGDPEAAVFCETALAALMIGSALVLAAWHGEISLSLRQGFLLTVSSWLVVALFAAVPLALGSQHLRFVDAFFEAMSGLTTTGSTVLTGLDHMSEGLLLWRSLLQWIGGIGIIVTGVAMLPFLRVGGMQLFRMESSDKSDKALPRAGQVAVAILLIYTVLTGLCAAAYDFAGMTAFEAINHAMTTLSTGGFSTSDQSMGHFATPLIRWVAVVFMVLGGLPFGLLLRAAVGRWRDLVTNSQVRAFMILVTAFCVTLVLWQTLINHDSVADALSSVVFNVVSVITTTGFAADDYTTWGSLPVMAFFFLTFCGACTGSTSGGIKIFRFEIMYRAIRRIVQGLRHPHGVHLNTYGNRPLSTEVVSSVVLFVVLFVLLTTLLTMTLALFGLDFVTSLSGAATALANVGPGLGEIIGPAGNFATLPDGAKWALSFGMLAGRLEIVTVLVLLLPDFWQP